MDFVHMWILKQVQNDSGRFGTSFKETVPSCRVILNLFQDPHMGVAPTNDAAPFALSVDPEGIEVEWSKSDISPFDFAAKLLRSGRTVLVVLQLIFPLSLSAHPSLFFTDSETQGVSHNPHLHLQAIMYIDPDHWTLWINDHVIHASDPRQIEGVLIEHVAPQTVQFAWHSRKEELPKRFTLRVNEVFNGL